MQQAKGRAEETMIINYRLDKLRTKIHDIHNQLESCGEPFDFKVTRGSCILILLKNSNCFITKCILQDRFYGGQ